MKTTFNKIVFSLTILFFTQITIAQQSLFDKYMDQEVVTSVVVNKKMFSLLSKMKVEDKQTQQYVNLLKKLDNLKVFVTQNSAKAAEMKLTADKYLKSSALDELMRVNDKGKQVKIFVKSGTSDTQIKELFMFIEGSGKEETVLMSLLGSFDLDELSVLTDKMNLPGGEDLKKAAKTTKK